jgi:hypothetical protein
MVNRQIRLSVAGFQYPINARPTGLSHSRDAVPPAPVGEWSGAERPSFPASSFTLSLAFPLLLGLEIFAGLLVDHLHGQPNLTALVET